MMDYQGEPCPHCGEKTAIYHQYIGDAHCETCGNWRDDEDDEED